mmetsp:Transcript_6299/g.12800  ORF Transcript_6299/g.12800 Transcript_6299/m.12800 type:complete len:160 (-) Transcript_6299:122-601(-)|eukprot:CAMPEP_0118932358 /NCGR_PEP_ID=MMETSP1169-20130426/9978_1 /TAXON_ID=36882 /ORGANISM="Pyramimonas obovata, Strain CCMP722" /LENGTH=159 /DNA_ID=CAMNT_0006875007 /DNA_START=56 /DNA_END=535 /DNA_ORIENTATION=+
MAQSTMRTQLTPSITSRDAAWRRAPAAVPVGSSRRQVVTCASASFRTPRRGALIGLASIVGTVAVRPMSANAEDDADNALIQSLLKKSQDNKAKNDAERFNYDKQYESYLSIIKSGGYVPKTKAEMEKLQITKPAECGLPVFDKSKLCADWDAFYATLQ